MNYISPKRPPYTPEDFPTNGRRFRIVEDPYRLEFGPDGGRKAFILGLIVFVVIGFMLGCAWPADAQTLSCIHGRGALSCAVIEPRSNIIDVPGPETAAEADAQDARIAKWESFCNPTPRVDAFGVTRYSYAKPGCDFGRSE